MRPWSVGRQTSSCSIVGKLSFTILFSEKAAIFTIKIMKSFHTYYYNREEEKIFKHVQNGGWEIQEVKPHRGWRIDNSWELWTLLLKKEIPKNIWQCLCMCVYLRSSYMYIVSKLMSIFISVSISMYMYVYTQTYILALKIYVLNARLPIWLIKHVLTMSAKQEWATEKKSRIHLEILCFLKIVKFCFRV